MTSHRITDRQNNRRLLVLALLAISTIVAAVVLLNLLFAAVTVTDGFTCGSVMGAPTSENHIAEGNHEYCNAVRISRLGWAGATVLLTIGLGWATAAQSKRVDIYR